MLPSGKSDIRSLEYVANLENARPASNHMAFALLLSYAHQSEQVLQQVGMVSSEVSGCVEGRSKSNAKVVTGLSLLAGHGFCRFYRRPFAKQHNYCLRKQKTRDLFILSSFA
ncbi:hypothetical protein RvY_05988 [Ramazzottius varieornatus]|uniref:Uncharacterized protein n=1 Tax=Ramazzottius varieornatus TaxID=947166 RepID=A0A1D1V5U4_RAMVA|nr:hypothetical protein RvY_05988 [Ramazzottius varieornatus]